MVRPRQVSDQEILIAARDCFVEHGPGVSTTVIAERLGISQAALFKRFGTKDDLLFTALAPPPRPPWADLLEQGPDDRDIREQLVEMALVLGDFFERMIPAMSVLRASGVCLEDMVRRYDTPPPVHGVRAVAGWFRAAAASGRLRAPEPDALALAFLGGLHMRVFLKHIGGGQVPVGDLPSHAESMVDALWQGIAPVQGR